MDLNQLLSSSTPLLFGAVIGYVASRLLKHWEFRRETIQRAADALTDVIVGFRQTRGATVGMFLLADSGPEEPAYMRMVPDWERFQKDFSTLVNLVGEKDAQRMSDLHDRLTWEPTHNGHEESIRALDELRSAVIDLFTPMRAVKSFFRDPFARLLILSVVLSVLSALLGAWLSTWAD